MKATLQLIGVVLIATLLFGCDLASKLQDKVSTAVRPSSAATASVALTGWRLECASETTLLKCREYDRMSETTSKTVLTELSFSLEPKSKRPTLLAQLPLGIVLTDQLNLSVGKRASQTFPILTCNQVGCFARGMANDDLIREMKAAKEQLRVVYNVLDNKLNKRTFTVTLGLAGFKEAYDKLK
jgi:invasion protein IalB